MFAFDAYFGVESDEKNEKLFPELHVGLIRRLMARLPLRLCRVCATKAVQHCAGDGEDVGKKLPSGTELAPYQVDMCIYHEHLNDVDRAECKAEAEAAKKANAKEDAEVLSRAREAERVARVAKKAAPTISR